MNQTKKEKFFHQVAEVKARLDRPLVLVGMMASGKTQLGRRLADALELAFADSDALIEERAGCKVAEVFTRDGEAKFRAVEAAVIKDLLDQRKPCVIATGGGAVTNVDTLEAIKAHAISLWLVADSQTLISRVRDPKTRPLLDRPDPEAALQSLMEARQGMYARADLTIPTGKGRLQETLEHTVAALYDHFLKNHKDPT